LVLAAFIAPAYSTSKAYVSKKTWTSAGCSGTSTLIGDGYDDFFADGTCIPESKATSSRRRDSSTIYRKVLCTANTANTGYTRTEYTDAACTTGANQVNAGSTDTCTQGGSEYKLNTCATTSATVGAIEYGTYSAAGCADAELNGAGFFLVNFCKMQDDGSGTWSNSEKFVIEGGQLKKYRFTDSSQKDCSGVGALQTTYDANSCQVMDAGANQYLKTSALIDGASIEGASTLAGSTGNNAGAQNVLNSITMLLGLALSFVFILY